MLILSVFSISVSAYVDFNGDKYLPMLVVFALNLWVGT